MSRATCTAFDGPSRIASGALAQVAARCRRILDRKRTASILIFDDGSGEVVDVDFRGTPRDVARRIADAPVAAGVGSSSPEPETATRRGPGRPKLGVVAREVTLLPRHWVWLSSQPGGASVALRRLVDEARRVHAGRDRVRRSQEAAYRFTTALAGNRPGFEEAMRALFAADADRFDALTAAWPSDVRHYARRLAAGAFGETTGEPA